MDIVLPDGVITFIQIVREGFFAIWGVFFFLPLAYGAAEVWLVYAQRCFAKSNPNRLVELVIPREVRKTPRAMEQIMTAIHALRNSPANFQEVWWDGETASVFSFEMASFGGEVHFYMWVPVRHLSIVRATIYSQYPEVDVVDVDDYTHRFPPHFDELEGLGYRMFGNELLYSNNNKEVEEKAVDVYPIRTYVDFEAVAEEKELDPISGILEVMAGIRPQEEMWLQFATRPLVDNEIPEWAKSGGDEINRLKARSRGTINPITGEQIYTLPSPGETEAMKVIDRNVGKPGFKVVIRYLYFAPKGIFSGGVGQRGIYSALNHYATESFNKFKHNVCVWTRVNVWYSPYFFPAFRGKVRSRRILRHYRIRKIYPDSLVARMITPTGPGKTITMNTEALATLFHLPTNLVNTGPLIPRSEAKRVGPPSGLGIFGEEGDEKLPGI